MKTCQLNVRISERTYKTLIELSKKLYTTKSFLIEKGIDLLKENFDRIDKRPHPKPASDAFSVALSKVNKKHSRTLKKLAE